MEEKKLLKVDTATSDKIAALQSIFQLLGWVALIGGVICTIVGIDKINDYLSPNSTVLVIGVSILITSFFCFFCSVLFRGIKILVQNAEYNNAIIEEEYSITKKEKLSDYNVVA